MLRMRRGSSSAWGTMCTSVLGSERNMKITKPADMELARFYLEREAQEGLSMNSSSTAKTILFWFSILFLGVMLWETCFPANGDAARGDELSYSEVDADNVNKGNLYLSAETATKWGENIDDRRIEGFHLGLCRRKWFLPCWGQLREKSV